MPWLRKLPEVFISYVRFFKIWRFWDGMYLDKLFFGLRGEEDVYGKAVKKEDLIRKKFNFVPGSKELVLVFPCWGGVLKANLFVRCSLMKKGYSVLEYEFPSNILSCNPELTRKYFDSILKEVLSDVSRLKKERGFSRISIVGLSLGCVNACMVADKLRVSKLFLALPGSCLAEAIWNGIATQKLRRRYEDAGISLKDLKRCWRRLAPENNVSRLDCEAFVFRSSKDLVIQSYLGKSLVSRIKSVDCAVDSWMGHYLGVLGFWLFPGRFWKGF